MRSDGCSVLRSAEVVALLARLGRLPHVSNNESYHQRRQEISGSRAKGLTMFVCPNGCAVDAKHARDPVFRCPTCKGRLTLSVEGALRLELLVLQTQIDDPARGYGLEAVKEAWAKLQAEVSPELLLAMELTQAQLREIATKAFRTFGIELA